MAYIPPVYKTELQPTSTAFKPNKPTANSAEIHQVTTSCLVKILPKVSERIDEIMLDMKNQTIGYLPAKDIDTHFRQNILDFKDVSVEYLVIRRSKKNIDINTDRDNVFSGYTSFPGGVQLYCETSLDSVIRNTYIQTGIDLTDHEKYCMIAQSSNIYKVRYLPNKRIIAAKPFIFLQLVPEVIPLPNPNPDHVSMYLWSHVDFLYKCNVSKHIEYREVTTEMIKRKLSNVKLAHLKIANAEKYNLEEVVKDCKKCDPMFSLCGVTLGMALSLLEAAPNVYDPSNYSAIYRKQYSIQLKRFNPEYLGIVGDKISEYVVYQYLTNRDKKWQSMFEDTREEIIITKIYPSLFAIGALAYLIKRTSASKTDKKVPALAKI